MFKIIHSITGHFYTVAGHEQWSDDESLAQTYDDEAFARSLASQVDGMVVPA